MKTPLIVFVAAVATALPGVSFADLAFSAGAFTDHRFRGISQTRLKPALHGGLHYSTGALYVGACSWSALNTTSEPGEQP